MSGPVGVVVAALVGYALGAVNPATLIARARGVDLRQIGSGNPGASNVGRALGRKTGVLVALLDVAKGAVPAAGFGGLDHEWGLVAGLFAVLGHVTSPYLRGRGGKGVATAAGAILGSHPLWLLVVLGTWLAVLGASRWIALASICAALSVLVVATVSGHDVWWAASIAAVVLVRHAGNVQRRLHHDQDSAQDT
jgi:glycerol-3-phosphate acyltransferase PlsY